ncbi:hypothetical protein TDB9533_00523 [Thalassocella blandensis]|nr:hypothetical protein TDB9533_00523 [Thalassocella blandensis]
MLSYLFLLINAIIIAVIVAHHGGGGTDPEPTPTPTPTSTPTTTPSPTIEPTVTVTPTPQPDIVSPTASIIYPWQVSSTKNTYVNVRGVAADNVSVANVYVNGEPASIYNRNTVETEGGFVETVEWEYTLNLVDYETEIIVEVEDTANNYVYEADTAVIAREKLLPTHFNLIEDESRVIGLGYNANWLGILVDYDLVTGEQREISPLYAENSALCYFKSTNELIYPEFNYPEELVFYSMDLATLETTELVRHQISPVSDDIPAAMYGVDSVCDDENRNYYFYMKFYGGADNQAEIKIEKLDLSETPEVTLVTNLLSDSNSISQFKMVLGNNDFIALLDGSVVTIAPDTGVVSDIFTGYPRFTLDVVKGSNESVVYLVHFDGVDRLDVSTGSFSNISPVENSDPLSFSQVGDSAFDPIRNKIIVSDSELEALIEIDVTSGERTLGFSQGVGSGSKLVAVRDIVMSDDMSTLFLADDGNATEKLMKVDLATGNRTKIGDISDEFNFGVDGIVLDEEKNVVYVANNYKIFVVSLSSNETTVLLDGSTDPSFSTITDMAYSESTNRLLFVDEISKAMFSFSPETLELELVSQEGVTGEGLPFVNVNNIVVSPEGDTAYVTNQGSENIMKVNLETGDREVLVTQCENLGAGESLKTLTMSEAGTELFASDNSLRKINIASGACEDLWVYPLSDVQILPGNTLIYGGFKTIEFVDLNTFNSVSISK